MLEAHQGAQPRHQHDVIERLVHEVVGAGLKTGQAIVAAVERGQQDNRNMTRVGVLLELPADLVAIDAGHHDVEQDNVGLRRNSLGNGAAAVRSADHLIVIGFELGLEQAHIGGDVVDDQDARGHDV